MKAIDYANSILMRGTILETSGFIPSFWIVTCSYCGRNETESTYEQSEKWLAGHYQEHIEDED